jgi:hypothetical protein
MTEQQYTPTTEQVRALADEVLERVVADRDGDLDFADRVLFALRSAADQVDAAYTAEVRASVQPPTREQIVDEVSGIVVGSGYYSMSIGIDAAREVADAVLALLSQQKEDHKVSASCAACGTTVYLREDGWWVDEWKRGGLEVLNEWHQHKPHGVELPPDTDVMTGTEDDRG